MSRAWRIEYEGALYHLLSRGNEGGDLFFDERDRHRFLDTIEDMSQRFEIDVFAYVLMNNHYHLLIRTRRRHARSGHLFQGRYKSIIVQNDAYLLELSCYIHRNPLRAKMVKRLADYRWSSYRVYAYNLQAPKWLSTDLILSQFEGEPDRHASYRKKVQKYAREEKRLFENLRFGLILGSKQFVDKIRKQYLPSSPDASVPQQNQLARTFDLENFLVKAQSKLKCNVKDFVQAGRLSGTDKEKRDLLVYFIWQTGCLRNKQIGNLFGISYSAVSHTVSTVKAQLKKDRKLQAKFKQFNSQFNGLTTDCR